MHELDEVLLLYAGQDALTQKYLLSLLPTIPALDDALPLLDHLWAEAASPDARIAHQARLSLGRALPAALAREYELSPGLGGVWSLVGQSAAQKDLLRRQAALSARSDQQLAPIARAALERLDPLVNVLVPLAVSPAPPLRTPASILLGLIRTPRAAGSLALEMSRHPGAFDLAAALAASDDPAARLALSQDIARNAAREPDALMLLAAGDDGHRAAILSAAGARTDAYGRSNIAQALQGASTPQAFALLETLIRANEGWVSAYALDAAIHCPPDQARMLVQLVWDLESLEFLLVKAVQCAGHLSSPWAVQFLLECLSDPHPRVQAAALEGLARRRADPAALAPAATRMLDSPLLKARVNAILTLAPLDRTAASRAIHTLLYSSRAMHRLEAAYVLGYVRGTPSVQALEQMATADPSPAVQVQAVKSLARQPAGPALPALERLISGPNPHVSAAAAGAAAGLAGESPDVVATLERVLAGPVAGPARAAVFRALGRTHARAPSTRASGTLVDGLSSADPLTRLAALEAAKHLGDALPRERVRPLMDHADPRIGARASLAMVLSGDLAALEPLERMLAGSVMDEVQCSLRAWLELAVALPGSLRCARFSNLARALGLPESAPAVAPSRPAAAPPAGAWMDAPARAGASPSDAFDPAAARSNGRSTAVLADAPARPDGRSTDGLADAPARPGGRPSDAFAGAPAQANGSRPAASSQAPVREQAARQHLPSPLAGETPMVSSLASWRAVPAVEADGEASAKLRAMYLAREASHRTRTAAIDAAQIRAASYIAGSPVAPRRPLDRWRPYAPLAVIPLVLLLPALLTFWRYQALEPTAEAALEPIPSDAFRVTFVQGAVTCVRGGRTIHVMVGDGFLPGDSLSSSPRGGVALADGSGASIWLGSDSALSALPGRRVLQGPSGEVALDFREADGGELVVGAALVGLAHAAVKTSGSRTHVLLEVTSGKVTVRDATGQRDLLARQTRTIDTPTSVSPHP